MMSTCARNMQRHEIKLIVKQILASSWLNTELNILRCTCFSLQPGHYSSLAAPKLQLTTNQERNDQCGNQHYSREVLMTDIVVPETCSAYKVQ